MEGAAEKLDEKELIPRPDKVAAAANVEEAQGGLQETSQAQPALQRSSVAPLALWDISYPRTPEGQSCNGSAQRSLAQSPSGGDAADVQSPKRLKLERHSSHSVELPVQTSAVVKITAAPSPKAALLIQLVLYRAGHHVDKAIDMLRQRVASGRKVHSQKFTKEEVEEAVRCFKAAKAEKLVAGVSAPASRGAVQPEAKVPAIVEEKGPAVAGASCQAAYHGSYMSPAAVSRMVGDELCAICLDPLRNQAQTIALCGHIYHRSCLNEAGSVACPKCRGPVDMDRARLQELKSLIISTRRTPDPSEPDFLRCNLLELSRGELLASCNARRRSGQPLYGCAELAQALDELGRERQDDLLVDADAVVIML